MANANGGIDRLEAALVRLAEAQARTEERLGRLEETQARTEAALARLAEAQARTEERVGRLEEAQVRTEERLAEVAAALDRLARQVGGLSDAFGGEIEDIAQGVVYATLRRELGWDLDVWVRKWVTWDGEPQELDFFGEATDSARPDVMIWIVGEAKHNLTEADVRRFARVVERARRNLGGEVFPVCFCYRARPEVQRVVEDAGLRLVFSYGKLV
jgi:hypothetical protein